MGSETPLANPQVPASAQLLPAVEDRSFSIVRSAEINFDWEELETSQLLYKMYGFVHPLPLLTQPSLLSQNDRSLLSVIVGLQRNDTDFFKSPVVSFTLEFLELLGASKIPKNATWDIANGNRMSISGSGLFRQMRVIECTGNLGGEKSGLFLTSRMQQRYLGWWQYPMSLMLFLCVGWITLAQEDHPLLTSKSLESY